MLRGDFGGVEKKFEMKLKNLFNKFLNKFLNILKIWG